MKYPYFISPVIEELRNCDDPSRAARLREIIAANVGNPQALIALIGDPEADLRYFYPDEPAATLSTDATIDSFLSRFGGSSQLPSDSPLFPSENFAEVSGERQLGSEEDEVVAHDAITLNEEAYPEDGYLVEEEVEAMEPVVQGPETEAEVKEPDMEEPEAEAEDDELAMEEPEAEDMESDAVGEGDEAEDMESDAVGEEDEAEDIEPYMEEQVAQVEVSEPDTKERDVENSLERVKQLVKNRDYQNALEILEAIYLKNPKKSIYFADQIRFIKKMMKYERR